jgi:nucleoside-diphosphate-sugar epimerase
LALEIFKEAHLILVTGAGGGLGKYLLDEIEAQGRPSTAIVRSSGTFWRSKVAFVTGDLRDREWLENLFREIPFQKVIHLAWEREKGLVRIRKREGENLQQTGNLLEMCQRYQVPTFLFASSLNAGLPKKNQYSREKEEAETMIRESAIPTAVIYRLSSLFGIGIQAYWNDLTQAAMQRKRIILLGEKPLRFQPLYAGDAARIILEERRGGTYYLVGPEILSDEDLIQTVGEIRGLPLKGIRVPLTILSQLLTPWAKFIGPFRRIQEEITALNQDKIFLDRKAFTGSCRWKEYLLKMSCGDGQ